MFGDFAWRGLYAITDTKLIKAQRFVETVERAIVGGARVVQYRDKSDHQEQRFEQARALRGLCDKYQLPLIINDDVKLAQQVGADGVHLGRHDANIEYARAVLGSEAIIGVSCYNQLSLARRAVETGASYVAFGSFFGSTTKPRAVVCDIQVLREARKSLNCPIIAIGGITPDNGTDLVAAGADCLAVIYSLFGQTDVTAAARSYAKLFDI